MTSASGGIGGLPPSSGSGSVCEPGVEDCAINHASTGWCSLFTGQPVIIITRIGCEPDAVPQVITVDPETGDVIPNGPVVPCGDKDWEVNQLCDVDQFTGQVIATVTQIFEWDETTGSLNVTLSEAGSPGVPYTVLGQLQTCSSGQLQAIEVTVCGNDNGTLRQLTEVVLLDTLDGNIRFVFYIDGTGAIVVPGVTEVFSVGDCWSERSLVVLEDISQALSEINNNTDGLEACCATTNLNLSTIIGHVDALEGLINIVIGHLDGVEPLLSSIEGQLNTLTADINTQLNAVNNSLVSIANNTDGIEATLQNLLTVTNSIEACCASNNALLTNISSQLSTIDSSINSVAACCASTNTVLGAMSVQLTAITGHVDGIEPLLSAISGQLTTVNGNIDNVESLISTTNLTLSTVVGHVDGIETLLSAVSLSVDGLEACCAQSNVILQQIEDNTDEIEVKLDQIVLNTNGAVPSQAAYRNINLQNIGQVIKSSSGRLYTISLWNQGNAVAYVKFYNINIAPTATDTPVLTLPVGGTGNGDRHTLVTFDGGLLLGNGIGIRATTGVADNNNVAPALNQIIVNIGYA